MNGPDDFTLEELQAWKERIDAANFNREPLHVTPEEYRDLVRRYPPVDQSLLLPWERPIIRWVGTPIIIDYPEGESPCNS